MTKFAFSPPEITGLPIAGRDDLFPVRRVYCVGRNYAAHAIEMGHDPDKAPPFFFQKNPNNLDPSGEFPYPDQSDDVHHEIELAVMLQSGGTDIAIPDASSHIFGYALSLDMTRRDLQAVQKKLGRPWEIGKAFERSAPVGPIHPKERVGILQDGEITLTVNGEIRQQGNLNQMIWKVPEMISHLSEYYDLAAGDVILFGTSAGVGPVAKGDEMVAMIEGVGSITVRVV